MCLCIWCVIPTYKSPLTIYKSQIAVAEFMSFSSACLKLTNTLLLYFPLDSRRTDVTPQKIACSGPLTSVFPQIPADFVI